MKFDKQQIFKSIPKSSLIIGIAIFVLYSFSLYALLYIARESFRLFTITAYYDLLVLSDKQVYFYNLFFAFIAVIFGQSVCFIYWFDKPRPLFSGHGGRQVSIVNDQRNLNWYFLFWFAQSLTLFGFFFYFASPGGYHVFSFFPDYAYIAVLLVIVLYLNTWITLRRYFKSGLRKWFLIVIIVLTAFAFTLSNINFIDYKRINELVLSKNIYHTYQLELPEVKLVYANYEPYMYWNKSYVKDIFVVLNTDVSLSRKEPLIIIDHEIFSLDSLKAELRSWKNIERSYMWPFLRVPLSVDGRISMRKVDTLHRLLASIGINWVHYAVLPASRVYDDRYYYDYSISKRLGNDRNDLGSAVKEKIVSGEISRIIHVRVDDDNCLQFDNRPIEAAEIAQFMETEILADPTSMFIISYSASTNFSAYLFVYSQILEAIFGIRNLHSQSLYAKPYLQLTNSEQIDHINKMVPINITTHLLE